MRLAGRRAIVTGAASGIGRAAAELFAAEGASVLAVDRPSAELKFTSAEIRPLGLDITGKDAPREIVETAITAFGGLDILYNNAGVGHSKPASTIVVLIMSHRSSRRVQTEPRNVSE